MKKIFGSFVALMVMLSVVPSLSLAASTITGFLDIIDGSIALKLNGYVEFGTYKIVLKDLEASTGGGQYYSGGRFDIYKNGIKIATVTLGSGESYEYTEGGVSLFKIYFSYGYKDENGQYIGKFSLYFPYDTWEVDGNSDIKLNVTKYKIFTFSGHTVKITLKKVKNTETEKYAKFEVRIDGKYAGTKTIDVGATEGFDVSVTPVGTFRNFIAIKVLAVYDKGVEFNLFYPHLAYTTYKFEGLPGEPTTTPTTSQTTAELEPTTLVYDDLLYVGEILTLTMNDTKYKLRLNSIGYYSSISIFDKNDKPLETFNVREGSSYTSKKAPIRIEIPPNSVDLAYNRTYIKIYAPSDTKVSPIIREAKIKVNLDTSVKEMLLNGEELVVFVNVENRGRGKAFGVNVIAPLPNNFELKSGIGTWSLKTLDAFTKMPVLVYTLKPTQVGKYNLGKVKVEYYNEAGQKKVVTSNEIRGIIVYSIPEISLSAEAFNGTWSNYITTQEKSIKLRFKVSAGRGNPKFEFIKNATLELILPDSIDGETAIKLGDIKAGEEKIIEGQYVVLKQAVSIIGTKLKYQDPLGNWHEKYFGNLLIINSIPPKVVVKENIVKVYPKPEELPDYIKKTLSTLKDPTPLAQTIENITKSYIPKKPDYKTPLIGILLILVIALGAATVNYKNKYEIVKSKLERRKKRPGGLPKKEEEEQEAKPSEVEKEETP